MVDGVHIISNMFVLCSYRSKYGRTFLNLQRLVQARSLLVHKGLGAFVLSADAQRPAYRQAQR